VESIRGKVRERGRGGGGEGGSEGTPIETTISVPVMASPDVSTSQIPLAASGGRLYLTTNLL